MSESPRKVLMGVAKEMNRASRDLKGLDLPYLLRGWAGHINDVALAMAAPQAQEEPGGAPAPAGDRCPACGFPWTRKPGQACPTADCNYVEPAPGTPIEKAAREALEKINQAIDALMVVAMNSRDKDGIVYLLRAARASLSSLPQEPAGGWYDPAHDCEDHCTMCQGLKARRAAQEGAAGEGGAA